jgi:hypothetical protein
MATKTATIATTTGHLREHRRRGQKWDRDDIQTELRRLFKKKKDISSRRLRLTHSSLYGAAIHWFGSLRKAVESAGIDYDDRVSRRSKNHWSPQEVAQRLKDLRRRGEPIHHAVMDRDHAALMVASYRYFGGYGRAVSASGIDYFRKVRVRPQRTWNTRRVGAEIRQLKREGHGLWPGAVRRRKSYLLKAARQLIGSYKAAARAVGIKPSALCPPPFRKWSPDRVIEELQQMNEAGEDLHTMQLLVRRPSFYRTCCRRFGTYRKALSAAGIAYPPKAIRHWTEPVVLQSLRDLYRTGEDMRHRRVKRRHLPLYEACRHYFGTYVNAVRVAGINYDKMVERLLRKQRGALSA